ncbi:EthD family reductase [Nocardioides sp.]|uniref:EthD family reductase n=1 Tax=Nocardioides sp. TaxID=35761 RepID=UPI0039E4C30A
MTTLQLFRLLPENTADGHRPASAAASGRHTYLRFADPSPIESSHRGPQSAAVETWLVDSVEEADAVRTAVPDDGSVWVTTRRHVVLGGAPLTEVDAAFGIKMVVGMCRREGMSVETFQQHWLTTHSELTLEAPGTSRYEIALPVVDEYLRGEPAYDGFAELWWRSQADLDAYLASPVMGKVGEDMELFVSSSRPFCSLYSTTGERWL